MISDPVEDRVGERHVGGIRQLELEQVGVHEAAARRVEPARRLLEHRGRAVDADHRSPRQLREQELSHATAVATSVENGLVPLQVEACDHPRGPFDLRSRDPIVGPRIPIPGPGHGEG